MTDDVRSYYGRPVLKAPVWRWMVPAYFFTGGVAAGSALLGAGARLTGDDAMARRCTLASFGAVAASTALLVGDLGRPARFLNMLRVARPTSPMSVGSWLLFAFGTATTVAAAGEALGVGRRSARLAEGVAALLAPAMATYTAVLVADTAVPVWHEARAELPFVFAGGALASAGGLAVLVTPTAQASAARRAAVIGTALELVAARRMERRLGELAQPYRQGPPAALRRLATVTGALGALVVGLVGRRRRSAATIGGALLLLGAAAERFAVFQAGFPSALDPGYTVGPQRRRLDRERGG